MGVGLSFTVTPAVKAHHVGRGPRVHAHGDDHTPGGGTRVDGHRAGPAPEVMRVEPAACVRVLPSAHVHLPLWDGGNGEGP